MQDQDFSIYRQSKQRNRILEILRSTKSHPTADWIYKNLKSEFPKLSLGTVYRNLSVLEDQGLVKKIHFGSTFDRFEANNKQHYHLICDGCGKIVDFNLSIYDEINNKARRNSQFNSRSHKLEFYGLCENCNKTK